MTSILKRQSLKTLTGKQFDVRNKMKIKMENIGELTL